MTRPALVLAAAMALTPLAARAGSVPCWFEHGVVVAPGVVAGVAGDYILDTGAPSTQLHETRAQGAGFDGTYLRGEVSLAGLHRNDRPVAVADLDARTWFFDTPIAGVIGADVLAGQVLDIDFSPCRVSIRQPSKAPPFTAQARLRLDRRSGVATGWAAVSDGARALRGPFVLATGADAAVRLAATRASAPGADDPQALLAGGGARAGLRALSFGGELFESVPAGLLQPSDGEVIGVIGAPVLAHWRVRFDFSRHVLLLGKKKGPPDRPGGP